MTMTSFDFIGMPNLRTPISTFYPNWGSKINLYHHLTWSNSLKYWSHLFLISHNSGNSLSGELIASLPLSLSLWLWKGQGLLVCFCSTLLPFYFGTNTGLGLLGLQTATATAHARLEAVACTAVRCSNLLILLSHAPVQPFICPHYVIWLGFGTGWGKIPPAHPGVQDVLKKIKKINLC